MIQALRSHIGGYVAKTFLALVVASFAVWGIGDVVRAITNPDRPAVVAGSTEITANEIGKAFQAQVTQLRQRFGQRFTGEQAAQLGILDQTVERLVADALFQQEAERLGLEVGPEVIRQQMRREPAFKDSTGTFTAGAFAMALRNAGLTEQEYVRMVRQGVDRQIVAGAIEAGALPPRALVVALERFRSERRTAEVVLVRHAAMTEVKDPTAEDLLAFHRDNAARFTAPEYRRGSILRLAVEDLAASLTVDEQALKEEYERHAQDYQTPERRELLQALVSEEADARKLAEAAAAGDFAKAAGEIAKLDAEALKLGPVAKSELPAELGDPIFAAPEGGLTPPVKSALGWHVFKVEKILPASVRSLDEVRDELRATLAKELASDQIARLSIRLEDEIVGGGSFDEAAQKLGLKVVQVPFVDRNGLGPDGRPADLPPTDRVQLVRTLFETESGRTSQLVETERGDFFVLRTEETRASALKPLDEVRDQVIQAWLADKRAQAAKAKAEELLEKAKAAAGDLAKAAGEAGLAVDITPPVTRIGRSEAVPPQVVAAIFSAKPGELARASTADAEAVVRTREILPPDAAEAEKETVALGQRLKDEIAGDLAAAFTQGLRQRYPVKIDQAQIQRMY
jgi:peptidyl-prolyl cis-trans isomerase D